MANSDMFIRMVMSGDASPFLKEVVSAESRFKGALSGMSSQAARMELFDKLKEDAKTAAAEFFKLKKEADALRQAIAQSESPGRDMEKMLLATEKALTKAETRMGKTRVSLQDMRHELQAAGVDTKNLAAEQEAMSQRISAVMSRISSGKKLDVARSNIGTRSDSDIQREIVQIQASYNRLAQSGSMSMVEQIRAAQSAKAKIAELKNEMYGELPSTSFLHTSVGKIAAVTTSIISLTAAIGLTKSILSTAGEFETLRTQLNSVEKSADSGARAFEYVKNLAVSTPYQVDGLTKAYIRLKNFGIDPTRGSLQASIDQSAALGGSQETLERITLALGQAWSKQKLQGEEAMQLVEAGVPVWDLLSQKLGKSAAELQTMASNGQLGRDVIKALMDAMEKNSAGAAAAQMKTWNGVVSNAVDLWKMFLDEIGQAGLLDFAKKEITDLTDTLNKMKETGDLSKLAHDIADAIKTLGEVAVGTARFLVEHRKAIEAVLAVYIGFKATGVVANLIDDLIKMSSKAKDAYDWIKKIGTADFTGGSAGGISGTAKNLPVNEKQAVKTVASYEGEQFARSGSKAAEESIVKKAGTYISKNGKEVVGGAVGVGAVTIATSFLKSLTGLAIGAAGAIALGGVAFAGAYLVARPYLQDQLKKLADRNKLMQDYIDLQNDAVKRDSSGRIGFHPGEYATVYSRDDLAGMTKPQLDDYGNDLTRSMKINEVKAKQRASTVRDQGGDPSKDAEYKANIARQAEYKKGLDALKKYMDERIKIEDAYTKSVQGVKNSQLAVLAESLAKEQKLYDKYNDLLKQATDTRLKHQDAWAGKKGTDPAEKAKDPQDMGVTDFYEGRDKASSLSRKAQDSLATYKQSGKDEDLRKYQQDAAAAEKQFQSLSDVIDKLREAGKITKGEYDWMNQSAGSLQDGFDAKTEKSAKDKLQEVMAKIESLKQAAESVKNLQIGFDTEKGMKDLESLMASFEQAARQRPIQIPTQFVGQDGKYLTDARKDVGLPATPYSLPTIQANAEGGLISGPGTGTSDSILSRLSNGEFVMTASAVGHYGPELMEAINQRRLPKFATGGLVGSLPSITDNLSLPDPERLSRPATPAALTPINIHLPGISDPVTMHGSEDAVSQLTAAARMLNLKQG